MEQPDMPAVLAAARSSGVRAVPATTSYFLGRERNAQSATGFFAPPPDRVVEPGAQIEF